MDAPTTSRPAGEVVWHRSVKTGIPEFPRHQKA